MPKHKLSNVLKRLGEEQRTGTLLCVGEDNVMGRVYLIQGKPRAARCRNLQGKEALLRINEKLLVSLKFHKDVNLVKSQAAMDTVEISDGQDRAFLVRRCFPPGADDVHRKSFRFERN